MKLFVAVALLAVATVQAAEDLDSVRGVTCPSAGYMIPDPENLCFYWTCTAPDTAPIKSSCPKGVRVPSWWEGGRLSMCFIVNIVKHGGDPVCLRCDAHDIPPVTERCASNPCDDGCTCIDTEHTFECQCPETGIYTDVGAVEMPVNHCSPDPCENGAPCENHWDGFFCKCPNGWTGHRCETSVCDWHPCENGGTCIIDEIGYHCECTDCWTGSCCTVNIPGCTGEEADQCPPCYTGADCETKIDTCGCNTDLCSPGTICVDDEDSGPSCQACDECMTGPDCKVRLDTCACTKTRCPPKSRCEDLSDVDSRECICESCYEGNSCDQLKNNCNCSNPCPNDATCFDDNAGPTCSCGECMGGDYCDEPIVSCNCNNPCGAREYCEMVNGQHSCGCSDECYTGQDCNEKLNTCKCQEPCVGDEICNDVNGSPVCSCPECYDGVGCQEQVNNCACRPCANDYETCTDGANGATCSCSDPCKEGPECDQDVQSCGCNDPCQNKGVCDDSTGAVMCNNCDACWTGDYCTDRENSCACDNRCAPFELCVDDAENGPQCGCPECYTGDECDVPVDSCQCNDPCQNGGVCDDSTGAVRCTDCDACWTGDYCTDREISCACDNRCAPFELCVDDAENVPQCGCPECYTGDECDVPVDNCQCNNPCKDAFLCKENEEGVPYCECNCLGDEVCFQDTVSRIPECRCPDCKRNADGERGCLTDITNLCECNVCTGDQEVCSDGEDEDGGVICKIGNPSSGNSFTVVFEENDTERSFREIPLELYITGAVWNSGTRFVNIRSAGLERTHHCYFNVNVTVPENKVERFTVERCMMHNRTGLENLAIRLTELDNNTMTVYGVNKDRWTADAFLAIPDHMAGTEFQTVSYAPAHISTQFAIAALYDDTEVTIQIADDNDMEGIYGKAGATLKLKMQAFQTFQVQARCPGQRPSKKRRCSKDLTGSIITASRPIHVFSGNVRAFIPAGEAQSRDHLIEELLPIDRWGMNFGLISVPRRAVGDLVTLMSVGMEETIIHVYTRNGQGETRKEYTLPKDGKNHMTIQLPSNGRYLIKSSGKLSVTQLTKSKDSSGGGYMFFNETVHDPVSITVPAISQFTNNFFISNPMFTGGETFDLQPYNTTLALLIAKKGEEGDIVLNDEELSTFVEPWGDLPKSEDEAEDLLVGAVVEIPVTTRYATNVIRNTEGKNFQCLIYGYDDRESYGMPAAMALSRIRS